MRTAKTTTPATATTTSTKRRVRVGRCQRVAVLTAVLVAGSGLVSPVPAFAVTTTAASSIDGGGYQNVIAVPPAGNTTYVDHAVIGGDVSGFSRSTNNGDTWAAANAADDSYVLGLPDMKAAALAWSEQTNSATVYALVGNGGSGATNGGVLRSVDAGATWSVLAGSITGDASENDPATVPRLVGRLIALDEADDVLLADKRIYVGSIDGVWRVPVGGATPVRITLAGERISSVVQDPNVATTLWVSVPEGGNRGVYKVMNAASAAADSAPTTKLNTVTPVRPWGLKEMGSGTHAAVWVVGDQAGEASSTVVSRCPAGGTSCADLTGGIPSSSTLWSSIDGYTDGSGVEHVFLGAFKGASSDYHVPVYRIDRTSADGSVTRTPLPANSDGVHNNVNGSGGPQWWVINQDLPPPAPPNTSNPSDRMGYGTYQTSQLVVDPSSTGAAGTVRLIAAGRAGAWRSGNAGTDWFPIPNGIGASINRHVLLKPGAALKVAVSDTDRTVIWSNDGLLVDQPVASEPDSDLSIYGMAVDEAGALYIGLGRRDELDEGGAIFRNPDLFGAGSAWASLGMPNNGDSINAVIGLSAHRVGANTRKLAVLHNDLLGPGLYYTDAAVGGWQAAVLLTAGKIGESNGQRRVDFAWQPNCASTSCWVFLFDPASGLWRSMNSGASWTRVDSMTSSGAQYVGFMAGDPRIGQSVLYVSYGPTAYQVTNLTSTVDFAALIIPNDNCTPLGGNLNSALDVDGQGRVWLTRAASAGVCPAIYRANGAGSRNLTDISDQNYRSQAQFPLGLTVAPNNSRFYVGTFGSGVLTGTSP